MFGYVITNQPELKVKDYQKYRGYYCGLCRSLKNRFGRRGQITLSYDLTFVDILLNSLYEVRLDAQMHRCMVHPVKKQRMFCNEISDYAADMCVLLTYYSLIDNWEDEKDKKSLLMAGCLKKHKRRIEESYPRQSHAIQSALKKTAQLEKEQAVSLDAAAGQTGKMLEEILVWRHDQWEDDLRNLGFYLGKFIYLMDAYEDMEEDGKKGSYNVWSLHQPVKSLEEDVKEILTLMMSSCAQAFERLPLIQDVDILRNILYSGIWAKYGKVKEKRNGEKAEED